ncbi:MAG: type II toxin-antitoxin system RelE family toxin [Pseudonocardiaceae bacterium]
MYAIEDDRLVVLIMRVGTRGEVGVLPAGGLGLTGHDRGEVPDPDDGVGLAQLGREGEQVEPQVLPAILGLDPMIKVHATDVDDGLAHSET